MAATGESTSGQEEDAPCTDGTPSRSHARECRAHAASTCRLDDPRTTHGGPPMRQVTYSLGLAVLCLWAIPVHAGKCPPDSVRVGTVCVDTYEASVWLIDPIANASLVKKVQAGKATLADLRGTGTVLKRP